MAQPATILIGPPELSAVLQAQPEVHGTELLVFSDTDARAALEAITDRRPRIIAVPKPFLATTRGQALIHRVEADPNLADTRIWIVSPDGAAPLPSSLTPAVESTPNPEVRLDHTGTRRAPRVRVRSGIEISVDGNTARLIDLSGLGAQVISPTILRPNQRIRVALPTEPGVARVVAVVAWAAFEFPKGRPEPQYRAGLEFKNHDPSPFEQVCVSYAVIDIETKAR